MCLECHTLRLYILYICGFKRLSRFVCCASLQRIGTVFTAPIASTHSYLPYWITTQVWYQQITYLHNPIDIFEIVNQLQWPVWQQWIERTLRRPQKHHSWQFRDTTLWGEREGLRPTATPFGDQFRIPRPNNYTTVIRVLHYHCALRHQ